MTFLYQDTPSGLVIEDLIETDLPTIPGDSGGLLVDDDIRPLGMLLGAASGRSYFVHLSNVANEFGLTEL
jgi:S1-C subfamily serine protease